MDIKYITYRLRWFLRGHFRFKYPIHVDIELNNNCNQSCLSCWHNDPKHLPFDIAHMSLDDVKRILLYLSKTCKSVKFNLRGEPVASPILADAVKYASELGYVDIMININLTMEFDIFKNVINAGLTTLIVSVDSFFHETYCDMHGCGVKLYNNMIRNLNQLKKLYMSKDLKCGVKFNFHVSTVNEMETEATKMYHNEYFPMFEPVWRFTEKREGQDISIPRTNRKRKRFCPHMNRRITYMANGKVYPCCVAYKEPTDIQIGQKGYISWGKRTELRRQYDINLPDTCRNCTSGDIYK